MQYSSRKHSAMSIRALHRIHLFPRLGRQKLSLPGVPVTAVSRYISRRAELVFEAVKMNRVSISLYDVAKSTGEVRDVFKFNYEDRPYICLSHSEKIRAGLEVSELIKRIAGVNFPVFIDDIIVDF